MVLLRDQEHKPLALMLRATHEEDLELAHLLSGARELRSALQWLLDDLSDAGEDAKRVLKLRLTRPALSQPSLAPLSWLAGWLAGPASPASIAG